jgi:hypothetical protein
MHISVPELQMCQGGISDDLVEYFDSEHPVKDLITKKYDDQACQKNNDAKNMIEVLVINVIRQDLVFE